MTMPFARWLCQKLLMLPAISAVAFLLLLGRFTGSQKCSDCDKLKEYTGDEGLWAECKECCTTDSDSKVLYDKVTLKVCQHRLRDFPHTQTFIEKVAAGIPQLKVAYVYGSAPTLVLKSGKQVDKLRIDNWKTENIVEFLQDRLKPSS